MTYNDEAKSVFQTLLVEVPEVGNLLSGLVGILWPNTQQQDVWDQVKENVETLIGKDIDDAVYSLISSELDGLSAAVNGFHLALQSNDATYIETNWIAINNQFVASAPKFCNPQWAFELLPLFAKFGTMHLALLREAYLCGQQWNLPQNVVGAIEQQYLATLTAYRQYVLQQAPFAGTTWQWSPQPASPSWATIQNNYNDEVFLWAYYWYFSNVVQFPGGVGSNLLEPPFNYYIGPFGDGSSEGYGGSVLQNNQASPWQFPLASLSRILLWTHSPVGVPAQNLSFLSGWQLTYGSSAPGEVQGPNLYGQGFQTPSGNGDPSRSLPISPTNPVTDITCWYGKSFPGVQFTFQDKTKSPVYGTSQGGTMTLESLTGTSVLSGQNADLILSHMLLSTSPQGTISSGYGLTAIGAMIGFRSAGSYPAQAISPGQPFPVPTLWAGNIADLPEDSNWRLSDSVLYVYRFIYSDFLSSPGVGTTVPIQSGCFPVLTLPPFPNSEVIAIRIFRIFFKAGSPINLGSTLADIPAGYAGTTWTDFFDQIGTGPIIDPNSTYSPQFVYNGWGQPMSAGPWPGNNWASGNSVKYWVSFQFADGNTQAPIGVGAAAPWYLLSDWAFPTIILPTPNLANIAGFQITRQFLYAGETTPEVAETRFVSLSECTVNEMNQYVYADQTP